MPRSATGSWRPGHDRTRDATYRMERDQREQAAFRADDPRDDDRGGLRDRVDRRRERFLEGGPVADPEPGYQRAARAGQRRVSRRRPGEAANTTLPHQGPQGK